jgi:Carboxypeptidase regulatory-like domain
MNKIIVQILVSLCSIYLLSGCTSSSQMTHSRFVIYEKNASNAEVQKGKSKIVGRLIDIDTHEPIVGAIVTIISSTYGVTSDINGVYEFSDLSPGTYNIKATMIGYESNIAPNIELKSHSIIVMDFELSARAVRGVYTTIKSPHQ